MMLPVFNQRNHGFTLIEMMLVIGIIAIISGATIPSFINYLDTQALEQTRQNILSDLRSVQNRAMTGEAQSIINNANPGIETAYWGIHFYPDRSSYDVFYSAQNTSCLSGDYQYQRTQNFNEAYKILNADGCMFFDMFNGDISPVGIEPHWVLQVGVDATNYIEITYNDAGLMYAE